MASRRVRDELVVMAPDGFEATRMTLASVLRAIWRHDRRLANILIKYAPRARVLLDFVLGIRDSWKVGLLRLGMFFMTNNSGQCMMPLVHASRTCVSSSSQSSSLPDECNRYSGLPGNLSGWLGLDSRRLMSLGLLLPKRLKFRLP